MASEEQASSDGARKAKTKQPPFFYGGQAVIEGVMIRGRRFLCVAVRRPTGQLTASLTPLNTLYTGPVRRIPLVRGVVVLAETMVLGMKALMYSTNVSLEQEGQEMGKWSMGLMLAVSLGFAVGVFFLLPLFVIQFIDRYVDSDLLSNIVEGVIRLSLFLTYIGGIGMIPDIKRVFAYHGAEHMTVKAHEGNDPLEIDKIRKYSTAHPRCGTAFLLVVMVIAIFVFALLGRPPMFWRIVSRVVLIPVIAGLAYEVIRFSGAHQGNAFVRLVTRPSLLLQKMTTRQPDDDQIEVAVHAMSTVLAADEGRELPVVEPLPDTDETPPSDDPAEPKEP
ncbi:MAG: DUF1385 domain-containing protein [Dehalococcoidia bacterium]